ncbi:tRNA pseudouridine(55) synthase TruB [Erysipelotrichaceae bacterium OttesenSCG-928-M19]|nr:tRNA pseudouridine(55) synthase TruB [Erysipelotrichaceae bacterium OttesenSCG-928-M19]
MNGIILINKEKQLTSHDVIYKLRKILKTKRVGHCGTLDPEATGVLVCLIGKATKLSNYLILDSKEYYATFKLGLATTTQDLTGEIVAEKGYQNDLSREDIKKVLTQYQGQQKQTPSIYSAIKVNGKKLYEYARNNEEVVIPTRDITVFELELLDFKADLVSIRVSCSSGTYIRTLCYDIAKSLNYPGVLCDLKRTKSGSFNIEASYTLAQIEANEYQLLSMQEALQDYPQVELNAEEYQAVRNGQPLECHQEQDFIVIYDNEVQAIYEKTKDGQAKMKRGLW